MVTPMLEIFEIVAHLLATVVRVAVPGGVRAVIVESLLLKHQLLVLSRSRKRASRLTPWDRLLFGVSVFLISPKRLPKVAIGIRPSTLLRFHRALIQRKYRLLFTSAARRRPGPKGPSKELIAAILEMKRRNPRFGCPRIAQQIAHAFGVDIGKDVVRRILAQHFRRPSGSDGPSWLTLIGDTADTACGTSICSVVNRLFSRATGSWSSWIFSRAGSSASALRRLTSTAWRSDNHLAGLRAARESGGVKSRCKLTLTRRRPYEEV
jgi:hypothetical protein